MAVVRTHMVLGILWLFLGHAALLHAQDFPFDLIDTRHGLSNNIVFSLYQDQEGYLWIGTADGVNRYDGYTFKVYRQDRDNPNSLSNNTVRRITEDPYGNLWVRTLVGWDRFDRETDQFFHRGPWPDSFPPYPLGEISDKHKHFWISDKEGIYRYDPDADAFRLVHDARDTPEFPIIAHDQSWLPLEDRQGGLWIGTEQGRLYHYNPMTGKGTGFMSPWQQLLLRLEDEHGRLWINHSQGTGLFDPATQTFSLAPGPPLRHFTLMQDRAGFYWSTGPHGLYRYDPEGQNMAFIPLDPTPLNHTQWVLIEDRTGTLWSSSLNGFYRYDPNAKPFTHRAHNPTEANGLSNNIVMATSVGQDRTLWVGTFGGGLNRIDPETGANTIYRHRAEDPLSLCDDNIWALYEDRRGTLWVGTNTGLCALDPQTGRFRTYPLPLSASWASVKAPEITVIREDEQGQLWIGTSDGLHRLAPLSGAVKHYTHVFHTQRPQGMFIQALLFDSAGHLWVGTSDTELYRFDPETEAVTAYPAVQQALPIANEGFLALHEDRAGVIWLSSIQGLTRFDPRTGDTRHYTEQDGLPASVVYAILEDDQRRLWVSTNNGLARFSDQYPEAQSFRNYAPSDGLGNTEFNRRAAFKSAQGEFFFGGMNGLTSFYPDQIRDNPYPPPVVLTQIETSNRDTTVSVIPYGLDHLVLSYQDYTVAFEFAALNFTNPTQNQYAYRLDGFDKDWIEAGTRRRVQYTNIPPGAYTFRVKASNNDGLWNETGVALRLTVTPPFWQTWWFRLGIGLLLLSTVVGLVRYLSTRKLREQIRALETQQRIQQERERISRDLHDHVGAQVSNIISGIELINLSTRAGKTDALQDYLDALDEDARRTMAQLRETIWTLHHDTVSLDALGEQLRRYAHRQQRYRERPAVHCTVSGNPDLHLSPNQALNVFRIAQEALTNVLKHANADNVHLAIEAVEAEHLTLTVRDDGAFHASSGGDGLNGYGLASMKRRAQELNGTFDLTQTDHAGTTVCVTLPIGQDP